MLWQILVSYQPGYDSLTRQGLKKQKKTSFHIELPFLKNSKNFLPNHQVFVSSSMKTVDSVHNVSETSKMNNSLILICFPPPQKTETSDSFDSENFRQLEQPIVLKIK